ncbi:MAG: hypothetical protein KGI25_06925, partial [Thaumarchaeota archaeon]|nr:hypothetical protein [Nitrososphaerota archaeon]
MNSEIRFSLPVVIAAISLIALVSHLSPVYADTYTYVKEIDGTQVLPSPLTLDVPQGVVVDSTGNIYVADSGHNRVVKFNPTGTTAMVISTFNNGDIFATPEDIAITSTGFLVTDEVNNRIVEFDSHGNYQGTFGSSNLSYPVGIAVDSSGYIYVADSGHGTIDVFYPTGQYDKSFTSTSDPYFFPQDVAVDSSGYTYATDSNDNSVKKFDHNGNEVLTFGTSGVGLDQFSNPNGITVDPAGYLLVTDLSNGRVEKFDSNGNLQTVFGSFTGGFIFNGGQFKRPVDIATDSAGNVYVTDSNFNNISVFNFATGGSPPVAPTDLTSIYSSLSRSVSLTWNPSPTATSYTIFRSSTPTGPFSTIAGTTTTTSFTDILGTATDYYEVSATSPSGESGFSNTAPITLSPTSGPVGTSITVTGTGFLPSHTITINYPGNNGIATT